MHIIPLACLAATYFTLRPPTIANYRPPHQPLLDSNIYSTYPNYHRAVVFSFLCLGLSIINSPPFSSTFSYQRGRSERSRSCGRAQALLKIKFAREPDILEPLSVSFTNHTSQASSWQTVRSTEYCALDHVDETGSLRTFSYAQTSSNRTESNV